MSTTESIVGDLKAELAGHIAAGRFLEEKACIQQINAHETLARLRAEYEANPSDALAAQIEFWRRNIDRDVDPVEPAKAKKRKPADEPPPGDA